MTTLDRPSSAARLLTPLAWAYGAVIRARNAYYDRVQDARRRAGVPVISVGNVTVGGTGKSPLVLELARRLLAWGRRPAVLTRGYRGTSTTPADEVREYHLALPGLPVVVDADRVAGATLARSAHHADCLLLDDGFQHRRLARDLDIVAVDALSPWGGGALLPVGRLREPLSSLRRADLLVVTRADQVSPEAAARVLAGLRAIAGETPVLCARVRPAALLDRGAVSQPLELLTGKRVLAVAGIGNPTTFTQILAGLAGECTPLLFRDHHAYGEEDVDRIVTAAGAAHAGWVVTTRKDWVKLAPLWPAVAPPLLRLDVTCDFGAGGEELDARLHRALEVHG